MRNGSNLLCLEQWSQKPSLETWSLSWILQDESNSAIQRVKAKRQKWQRSSLGKAVKKNWEGLSQFGHGEAEKVAQVEWKHECTNE